MSLFSFSTSERNDADTLLALATSWSDRPRALRSARRLRPRPSGVALRSEGAVFVLLAVSDEGDIGPELTTCQGRAVYATLVQYFDSAGRRAQACACVGRGRP